jgi:parallel beta-helix repeat protein
VIFEKDEVVREETLILEGKSNIELRFNGFTIQSYTDGTNVKPLAKKERNWPRNRSHLLINNCNDLKINNLKISGPHVNGGTSSKAYVSKLEAQHAIEITSSKNVEIFSADISQIFGDGVYVGKNSTGINITHCKIFKNGRQGIAITDGSNILIANCELDSIRRAHIDLECNHPSDVIENVVIRNNKFGKKRLKWIAAASSKGIVRNVTVSDNEINAPADIILGNEKNPKPQGPYEFYNNVSYRSVGNPQGRVWKLFNVNGFKAKDNRIIAQKKRDMIFIGTRNCKDIWIGENDIPNGENVIKDF